MRCLVWVVGELAKQRNRKLTCYSIFYGPVANFSIPIGCAAFHESYRHSRFVFFCFTGKRYDVFLWQQKGFKQKTVSIITKKKKKKKGHVDACTFTYK